MKMGQKDPFHRSSVNSTLHSLFSPAEQEVGGGSVASLNFGSTVKSVRRGTIDI